MPYFFILPAFALYVFGLGAVLIMTSFYRPIASLRPYVVSLLIWSSAGFAASTLLFAGVLAAAFVAIEHVAGDGPSTSVGLLLALLVFVGPFVAAAGGLLWGARYGILRARRRTAQG